MNNKKTLKKTDSKRLTSYDRKILLEFKKKKSEDNKDDYLNNTKEKENKQIIFLKEQSKAYKNDIENLHKNKEEIMKKYNDIVNEKLKLNEIIINKEKEISRYKIMINRLKINNK